MKTRTALFNMLAVLSLSAPAPAQVGATNDVVLFAKDQMVPMRDGVRLATDVYRPRGDGISVEDRFPVLLQRTP